MSGKKKIAYPIELLFEVGKPEFFNEAQDKYILHKEQIDRVLDSLKGKIRVGYVKRDRKFIHGINANSLNEAIRNKIKMLPGIEGETNVVFGSFLPPIYAKGEFDFSIYDKKSNFYNLWNYCYGKQAVKDGDNIINRYIKDKRIKKEWEIFFEIQKSRQYKEDLQVPLNTFNIIGEIQFGNWAMVYKDMFRLVSAINKKAKIDLYIYIVSSNRLKKLMSDGVVGFEDAKKRFQENVENHNINKPVMIVPLDVGFDIDTFDFSDAEAGYEDICKKMDYIAKQINESKEQLKNLRENKKNLKDIELDEVQKEIRKIQSQKKKLQQKLKDLKDLYKNEENVEEE